MLCHVGLQLGYIQYKVNHYKSHQNSFWTSRVTRVEIQSIPSSLKFGPQDILATSLNYANYAISAAYILKIKF